MFYVGLLGLVQATLGKRDEATATLLQQESLLAFLPEKTLPIGPIATCQALGAMALGEHELAVQCYGRLIPFQGQLYWFLVDRVLGMLAAGTLDPSPLVSAHMPLQDAPEAYAIYDRREALKIVLTP